MLKSFFSASYKEALTNVHRQAGASIVDVGLEQSSDTVIFKVRDNERDIETALLDRLRKPNTETSVGFRSVRDRFVF
jgi:signal transduction histidine kinase